ncbi:sensor histidine kinase [Lysinibacillus piscis]|uniref:histidine kinase n=1 Tax=Lysinibacillus piscis TaxID=2518931 RepID=A0ABQ5NFQ1_9BACI|nr:HAMP domain-containing sensor histidine kinase [Lysinibacillus sp. KH24]GLC87166.1 two-component sensor histidine kinase [Lysinibacillus sp. KH24]
MKKIYKPYYFIVTKIKNSIQIQLLTIFIICALGSLLVAEILLPFFRDYNEKEMIDYSPDMKLMLYEMQDIMALASEENSVDALKSLIERENNRLLDNQDAMKIVVTDETGKVLYKTQQVEEEQVNVHQKMQQVMSFGINQPVQHKYTYEMEETRREFLAFYPLNIQGENLYVFSSGIPKGVAVKYSTEGPMPALIGIMLFVWSFFYLTKRKMRQIEEMAKGVNEIAQGNLSYRIEKKGQDELASLAENVNQMAEAIKTTLEKERRIEQQKNELITNVSHDLRTPLTSIMGYLRLVREGKYVTQEQHDDYLKVAFSKSEQLQRLIDDLFDYTKLTNEKIVLVRQKVCINELLEQLMEELVPQAEQYGNEFVKHFSEQRIIVSIDSEKMVRVFDNLLVNAIKYSQKGTEIWVSLAVDDEHIHICIANYSDILTSEELVNIFERFYKRDSSRTSAKEGSGLGLAIAKSIVELHHGSIYARYKDDMLQFVIVLPKENLV